MHLKWKALFPWLFLIHITVYIDAMTTNPSQLTVDANFAIAVTPAAKTVTGVTNAITNTNSAVTTDQVTTDVTTFESGTTTDDITTTDPTTVINPTSLVPDGSSTAGLQSTTNADVFTSTDDAFVVTSSDLSAVSSTLPSTVTTPVNDVTTVGIETTTDTGNVTEDSGVGSTKRLTDSQIAVIISTTMCGLVFMLLLVAICAWLISNARKRSRGARRRRLSRRHVVPFEVDTYSKSDTFSAPDDIYVPYCGPPEVTSSYEVSPAVEPYKSIPTVDAYSPYLFDEKSGRYARGEMNPFNSNDWDRPYYSTIGIRNSFDTHADWYASMPNVEISLPRAWIRH